MNRRSFLLGTTAIVSASALPSPPAAIAPRVGPGRGVTSISYFNRRLSNEELCAASANDGMHVNFMTGRARFGGLDVGISPMLKLEGNARMTSEGLFIGDGGRAQLNIAALQLQSGNTKSVDV